MAAVDDRVERVELAVGALEGLGDALHAVDDVHALDEKRVDLRGVSHETDDGLARALRDVCAQALALDPVYEVAYLVLGCAFLDDSDHAVSPCLGRHAAYSPDVFVSSVA